MLAAALSSSGLTKIALSAGALLIVLAVRYAVVGIAQLLAGKQRAPRALFWTRQIANLLVLAGSAIALIEIWVQPGEGKALPLGLVSAGVAVALQKVWTAFAGYVVLLGGGVYRVGDRVSIGGIRGDVIALGFLYTRIMEMGEPEPPDQRSIWVGARQFTGRIVTVTNDTVFDSPVFNYTRDFPLLFEEQVIPLKYDADRERAEKILLKAAEEATAGLRQLSREAEQHLLDKYHLKLEELSPRVYYRLTDNWLELTLRFVVGEHGIRVVKDQMARAILRDFEAAGLGLASGTYEIVGLPRVQVDVQPGPRAAPSRPGGEVRPSNDERSARA
jgi:small-conductance mechanosensitive channel